VPRPRKEVPAYRLHKARNQGKVVVADDVIYFPGLHNSPESLAAYRRWLAEYLATGRVRQQPSPTVGELVLAYSDQVVTPRFCRDGKEDGESRSYKIALRSLTRLYVDLPIDEFTPRDLLHARATMVEVGYTRKRINQHVQRIRRMFKWGVTQGAVPVTVWQALTAVEGLRYGEAKKESARIAPVPEEHVEAIRPHVTPPVWTAVQFQLWTGARRGEALGIRTCDVVADDPLLPPAVRGLCWVYRLQLTK
jgi:hypothetical protein